MLRRASEQVGQAHMAEALGIEPRSLRAKLSADRGVSDHDLRIAATAVEQLAEKMLDQVRAIRAAVA